MSETTVDPYTVLGISHGANERQVRHAYRRLAKRYHPDLHPDVATSERMRRVNQAWEILSSPAGRANYDAQVRGRSPSVGHWAASRRSASMGSASTTWNGPSAPPPGTAPAYFTVASRQYGDGDGPGWLGVLLTVAIGMVAFVAVIAGILPFPLFGIALLVVVRGIFARFDDGG